jgi:hypothetical protein
VAPVYKFSNVGGFTSKTFYTSILAGNPKFEPDNGSIFPLGEFTLASAQSSITFSNIPQTYTHLQIRTINKNGRNVGSQGGAIYIRFNSDTTSGNYRSHRLMGDGATALSDAHLGTADGFYIADSASNSTNIADRFSAGIIDILDYRNTNKNKTVRSLSGADLNGLGNISLISGLWQSTSAINSIVITVIGAGAQNFLAYSNFALYGVLA